MNQDCARRVVQILEHYGVVRTPDHEPFHQALERSIAQRSIILLQEIFAAWVLEERHVLYDGESYEGLYPLDHLVTLFADATGGEWQPDHVRTTRLDTHEWIDFSWQGQHFQWEFERATRVWDCDIAIHRFARAYLPGNFVNAVGVPDQCQSYYYLSYGAIREIRALLKELRHVWPNADELIAFFHQNKDERANWECSIAALVQQSDLLHVNDLSQHGERPLHVAVQEVLCRNLDWHMLPMLRGYGAGPKDVDAHGKTAFDYAQGDGQLITWLQNSLMDDWIPEEMKETIQNDEWYLPIHYWEPWGSITYLE